MSDDAGATVPETGVGAENRGDTEPGSAAETAGSDVSGSSAETGDGGEAESDAEARSDAVRSDEPESGAESGEDPEAGSDLEYDRFSRLEGTDYDRANEFLRDRVAFTAREWALARLCADFRTKTGVEMTTIGEHLPELVPFMPEPYSRQAVYEARRSFEDKVREAGATFLYGGYSGFFTPDELDDILYESTEVARFLIEVEGASLPHDRETDVERRVREAMHEVHDASAELRYDSCPHCGEELGDEALADASDDDGGSGDEDESSGDDGPAEDS